MFATNNIMFCGPWLLMAVLLFQAVCCNTGETESVAISGTNPGIQEKDTSVILTYSMAVGDLDGDGDLDLTEAVFDGQIRIDFNALDQVEVMSISSGGASASVLTHAFGKPY